MEGRLDDRRQWPPDAEATEKARQNLDEIVRALSPVAAERILPQLARLNWGVEALWNLRTHANAKSDQLEEVQAAIKNVLERQPRGCFDEIHKELESRLKKIAPKVRRFQVEQLREQANRALKGEGDASAAFSSLKEFREETGVAEILSKLRTKVLEKAGLERIKNFQQNLKQTRSIADDRVRQVSLVTIQDGLLRLRVDLELEDAAPKNVLKKAKDLSDQCKKEVDAVVAKQQEKRAIKQQNERAEKTRRYQAWALKQIRGFDAPNGWYYEVTLPWVQGELKKFRNANKDENRGAFQYFPSLKALIQEKVGVDLSEMKEAMLTADKRKEIFNRASKTIGWKNDIDQEIAYRTTRDGIVLFLLPINTHLLDPPVAQLYQQAFSKGWTKLEGREDWLFVAEQSAIVRKKTLEEMPSFSR